ncbi:MAG: hypothetical protein R2734_09255 [Nocardioides sp.]
MIGARNAGDPGRATRTEPGGPTSSPAATARGCSRSTQRREAVTWAGSSWPASVTSTATACPTSTSRTSTT